MMHAYKAPLRDVLFSLHELNGYQAHYGALAGVTAPSADETRLILAEGAKFAERVIAPLNQSGDSEGARWNDGMVTSPTGFKEAYQQYVDAGWPRLGHSELHGGQDAPFSLKQAMMEFLQGANHAWCMYAALNDGAIKTLLGFAQPAQIEAIVPKLVSGEWIGTMGLTEAQSGSDLSLVRTRAEPAGEGRYRIWGTKMFTSSGENDFGSNIVHLVLARLPDAPSGTRGVSLFAVPKLKITADGSLGESNATRCVSIEHKMGIKGSATCVMAFDGAEGWLVGEPNRGLNCMFVFINKSRLGVGVQAHAHAEAAFQASLAYARERLQGRAPGGPVAPEKPADPLIAHADIRRMLLTQKAIAEGGRALTHLCGKWVDLADWGDASVRLRAERRLALLTPICKGALSEFACEAADLGIQVLGGHGYVKEWGVEQRLRDVRVARIYEGATGIQAMDLLGRKIIGPERETLLEFTQEILEFCALDGAAGGAAGLLTQLKNAVDLWRSVNDEIAAAAAADAALVGAVAVDYLMLSGYVTLAYVWARAAAVAAARLRAGTPEERFYRAKLQTARFYFAKILPRVLSHREAIRSGSDSLMAMDEADFDFS